MSLYIDKQTFETALPAIDSNRWKDDVIEPKHQGEISWSNTDSHN
jgi:hypothetical protein